MNEALLYLLQCKQNYNFLACRKLCSVYWCVKNLGTSTAERNVPRTRSWYRAQFLNIAMGLRNYLISLRNCTANIHFTWDALRGWRELIIWSDDVTSNACGERVLARRILWKRLSCKIKATLCQGLSPCKERTLSKKWAVCRGVRGITSVSRRSKNLYVNMTRFIRVSIVILFFSITDLSMVNAKRVSDKWIYVKRRCFFSIVI